MSSPAIVRRPGNLPAEVTSFVGRRHELTEAKSMLERSRLLTLLGPGGIGKTRIALQVAQEHRRSFADGTWLAELSAVRDTDMVPRAVADALQLAGHVAGDPVDLLADHLADRQLLLVLDTCEHVADACALLAEVLLRAAPRLRIIATSREPLDVVGEHTLLVQPFGLPGGSIECDSMELFAERAAAVVPGFALTTANREAVAGLCERLDGIPLAIELAAVRLRALSLDELLERLDNRFRLLGTARPSRGRHRTLRSTIDWSSELCTEAERRLWARLSVFPGGFDLAAAEAVCSDDRLPAAELLDLLSRLVEKSIVICDPGGRRYRMLDTLREYGAEQLATLGEAGALRRRHHDHYLALAEEYAAGCLGERQIPQLRRLRGERGNLRAALGLSLATAGEGPVALRMATALRHHWLGNGLFNEGRSWLAKALAAAPEPSADRCRALAMAGMLACLQDDVAAGEQAIGEARELAERLGDPELAAQVLDASSFVFQAAGDFHGAAAVLEDAVAAFEAIGYGDPIALSCPGRLALVLFLRGDVHGDARGDVHGDVRGDAGRALALCDAGIDRCRELGERWARSYTHLVRGFIRLTRGTEAATADNTSGGTGGGTSGGTAGGTSSDTGGGTSSDTSGGTDVAEKARADGLAALEIAETYGDVLGVTLAVDLLAGCATLRGEPERAAVLFGATGSMWTGLGTGPVTPRYPDMRRLWVAATRAALAGRRDGDLTARGAAMPLDEAVAFARGERAAPSAPPRTPLTRREQEIAGLVAEGLSNRDIADRLVVSKRTVDSHVEHILGKLGFASRTQIAVWVNEHAANEHGKHGTNRHGANKHSTNEHGANEHGGEG